MDRKCWIEKEEYGKGQSFCLYLLVVSAADRGGRLHRGTGRHRAAQPG
jgi:hypothetical protein